VGSVQPEPSCSRQWRRRKYVSDAMYVIGTWGAVDVADVVGKSMVEWWVGL
jgi:hypothetical protein